MPVEEGWTMSAMLALGYPRASGALQPIAVPYTMFHPETAGVCRSVWRYRSRCGRLSATWRPG
ncbi:putative nitroreductase domain protein [Mycobacterium xenopi 4042]|uniref:Putative nitroreductase domain protein n=1 Tax=Mycobacterium xenopi 4042 TaxID=1299334 RepID=X8BH50_MYCXE|nr:putative nitroreductase domain protein [Mycobacterium xenopi 4042]